MLASWREVLKRGVNWGRATDKNDRNREGLGSGQDRSDRQRDVMDAVTRASRMFWERKKEEVTEPAQ